MKNWFIDKFLRMAGRRHPESYFLDDIAIPAPSGGDDYDGPRKYGIDLVEIDGGGRLHLWLFVSLRAPEFQSGDVIGRLYAGAQLFAMADPARLAARLMKAARRRRYDTAGERFRRAIRKPRARFDSWNLVVCGGKGCELAGRDDNVLFRLYASLSQVLEPVRDANTWHFYQTNTGFDLRSVWDMASCARPSPSQRLAACAGEPAWVAVAPEDDFDITSKRDLHLKRRKGFHAQGGEAYFAGQAAAR